MKKLLCAISVFAAVMTAAFAVPTKHNETHEENWSDITYVQVPIYRIFDSKDAYLVIYAKNRLGEGKAVIPKKWAKGNPDNPRKLKIRFLDRGRLQPFMTVVKKSGEFKQVILNVPPSKLEPVWGLVDTKKEIEGVDKDTLEELEL